MNGSNTMQLNPFWVVRYNDDTELSKYLLEKVEITQDGNQIGVYRVRMDLVDEEKKFHDIVQKNVKTVEIWAIDQHGYGTKVFGFDYFPEFERLIMFFRGTERIGMSNGIHIKYRKFFFGWQMTIDEKNYQHMWSLRDDTGEIAVENKYIQQDDDLFPVD
jgi:hypothetical protein